MVVQEKKRYLVLKILSALFYALVTLFVLALFVSTLTEQAGEVDLRALGFLLLLIYCGFGYVPGVAISLAGIIFSAINLRKNQSTVGTLIYFIIFTVLPVVTFIVFLLLVRII